MTIVRQRNIAGVRYSPNEFGPAHQQSATELLAALALPRRGTVYDLDAGRWPGMPVLPVHPPFLLTTWRTPRRADIDGDVPSAMTGGAIRTGVTTELITASQHTGTHIDALCHITENERWFGGGKEELHIGDFGAQFGEASSLPLLLTRGVLLDIAAVHNVAALPAGHEITVDELEAAMTRKDTDIQRGDTVLIRTGYMTVWDGPDTARVGHYGAGIGVAAARYLIDHGVAAIGSDTEDFEVIPSPHADHGAFPVHRMLLGGHGIHIIELLYLEQLADAIDARFLFICLPLRIRGATGSMVRPVAIV
ncbi:cyclase family protein [Mycobacterium aquaticum]|uniref:Cyclase n=1 Tax=Mycobacterium aquaticum TaxID=1927124 RepID=A0A1X0BA99_9MYCO|nr:cyclase family protein [Mycobacterium aquaticum]ORA39233.1 hypothetical protein BST13_02925 [Mycobacterium aquaticum]